LAPFRPFAEQGVKLVLVMFADLLPDFSLVTRAAEAGFTGVMLDTAKKGQGGLRSHLPPEALERFVATAHQLGLLAGLAGSLAAADIAPLLRPQPDIMGFRGAACSSGHREAALDLSALMALRRLFPQATAKMETAGGGYGKLLAQET
jgi:dihydroneopterin aldolase